MPRACSRAVAAHRVDTLTLTYDENLGTLDGLTILDGEAHGA